MPDLVHKGFRVYCEELWQEWLHRRLAPEPEIAGLFSFEYAPEPYLRFFDSTKRGRKPLYILLTNPGGGRPEQRIATIKKGEIVDPSQPYDDTATRLADHYAKSLEEEKRPAAKRIRAIHHLMTETCSDCVVSFETVPFHSESLPGKRKLVNLFESSKILREYKKKLAMALANISVIAVSAVGTSRSISPDSINGSRWLTFQASLLGIDPLRLKMTELANIGKKVTAALLSQEVDGFVRGLVLNMGSNNLPGEDGRSKIAKALISTSRN